jgi:beta-glucanase (GH16 family)
MIRKPVSASVAIGLSLALCKPDGLAETANPEAYTWTEEFAGAPLALEGYVMTFSDEFDKETITSASGEGPWWAPVHADFGVATLDPPNGTTYTIDNGVLTIRATKDADGRWHGGNIQTIDGNGNGFAQQYGYFEARMRFPAKPGAWCAFWLKSRAEHFDRSVIRTEIDVIEWYGGNPPGFHRTVHLWPPAPELNSPDRLSEHWWLSNYSAHDALANEWHTYGALITPELVTIYLDRKEVARFPTLEEFKTPLYPLVSLTLYEQDVGIATPPIDMGVDYVRVYSRLAPLPPTSLRPLD